MIYTQYTNNLKVNKISVLIGYYKSHRVGINEIKGVGNRKMIWEAIIKISLLILMHIKLFVYFNEYLVTLQYYT